MQAQQISPHAATAAGEQQGIYAGPEHAVGAEEHVDHGSKKKSMLGKVKDKAKKLKSKMHKPKSAGSTDHHDESSSVSSSEDESGSDPHQQQVSDLRGGEKEIVSTRGLDSEAFEVIPDPHVNNKVGAAGVPERFGQMSLGDEPDRTKLQEEVPSAPGVTPSLASHNLGDESPIVTGASRVEEGKNAEGKDILVTPTSTDYEGTSAMDVGKTPEVSKTTDNTAAWYTPTSETVSDAGPLKDSVTEGATAAKDSVADTAAAGAGTLGVKSLSEEHKNAESPDSDVSGGKKSMLEQAKERIFGHSSKKPEGSQLDTSAGDQQIQGDENKPSLTSRAVGTVTSFKDTVASKLGYGSNKNVNAGEPAAMLIDAHNPENESVVQKLQDSATSGAMEAVTSKLGEQQTPSQAVGEEVGMGENKSYTQKAYHAASGAKDAVAMDTSTAQGEQKSYLQRMQETAVGAKDVVASKLGYANRDLPASPEGAHNDGENASASTAARFHPGEEDVALSQLITEKMSIGAATVKDTLLRPFGALKSGPPTPTTTPPPSSAAAVAADPVPSTVSGTNDVVEGVPHAAGKEKPGIVGKVTGAVTSLFGTSASGKKRVDEAASKATEDSQAAGVCDVKMD